jgi:hypothetical protein
VAKRPDTTGTLVGVRLQPAELDRLDDWIGAQPGRKMTRPEAVRAWMAELERWRQAQPAGPPAAFTSPADVAAYVAAQRAKADAEAPAPKQRTGRRRVLAIGLMLLLLAGPAFAHEPDERDADSFQYGWCGREAQALGRALNMGGPAPCYCPDPPPKHREAAQDSPGTRRDNSKIRQQRAIFAGHRQRTYWGKEKGP